jgi:hypothetical protein
LEDGATMSFSRTPSFYPCEIPPYYLPTVTSIPAEKHLGLYLSDNGEYDLRGGSKCKYKALLGFDSDTAIQTRNPDLTHCEQALFVC